MPSVIRLPPLSHFENGISTRAYELLYEAVRGSVPRGRGGTKTEGSANTGFFMKCSSSLAHVWCRRANASGDPRTGPPGYPEHTCSARTHCCSLTLLHVRTNKEFKRFILSVADICGSLQSWNWFNQAAKCLAGTGRTSSKRHRGTSVGNMVTQQMLVGMQT